MNAPNTNKHRVIDVRRQRNLTMRETFQLCIRGVRHRLFRSLLTLAVMVLAVAFFMFLLSESLFQSATGKGIAREIEHRQLASRTITRLFVKPAPNVLMRRLSRQFVRNDADGLAECSAVTGWPQERVAALAALANDERVYTAFFANMPTGKRLALVEKREGRAVFEYIHDNAEKFEGEIRPMVDLRIPGKIEGLLAFAAKFPEYVAEMDAFLVLWNAKIDAACGVLPALLSAKGEERPASLDDAHWLANAPDADAEDWRSRLVALGFSLPASDLSTMRQQLRQSNLRADLYARLNTADVRGRWTQAFKERRRSSADEKIAQLNDRRAAEILKEWYTPEVLADVRSQILYERRSETLERKLHLDASSSQGEELPSLSSRQVFLLCISFLVCMVGIANAMLMSITERFREIATMKCLGATDRYILLQFMMEAALQGVCGGVLGVLIGFLIAFLRNAIALGGALFTYWPALGVVGCGAFSLVVGVLLAVLASVQPSWSASRMAPMEAMRIE